MKFVDIGVLLAIVSAITLNGVCGVTVKLPRGVVDFLNGLIPLLENCHGLLGQTAECFTSTGSAKNLPPSSLKEPLGSGAPVKPVDQKSQARELEELDRALKGMALGDTAHRQLLLGQALTDLRALATDSLQRNTFDEVILPNFMQGNYAEVVEALNTVVQSNQGPQTGAAPSASILDMILTLLTAEQPQAGDADLDFKKSFYELAEVLLGNYIYTGKQRFSHQGLLHALEECTEDEVGHFLKYFQTRDLHPGLFGGDTLITLWTFQRRFFPEDRPPLDLTGLLGPVRKPVALIDDLRGFLRGQLALVVYALEMKGSRLTPAYAAFAKTVNTGSTDELAVVLAGMADEDVPLPYRQLIQGWRLASRPPDERKVLQGARAIIGSLMRTVITALRHPLAVCEFSAAADPIVRAITANENLPDAVNLALKHFLDLAIMPPSPVAPRFWITPLLDTYLFVYYTVSFEDFFSSAETHDAFLTMADTLFRLFFQSFVDHPWYQDAGDGPQLLLALLDPKILAMIDDYITDKLVHGLVVLYVEALRHALPLGNQQLLDDKYQLVDRFSHKAITAAECLPAIFDGTLTSDLWQRCCPAGIVFMRSCYSHLDERFFRVGTDHDRPIIESWLRDLTTQHPAIFYLTPRVRECLLFDSVANMDKLSVDRQLLLAYAISFAPEDASSALLDCIVKGDYQAALIALEGMSVDVDPSYGCSHLLATSPATSGDTGFRRVFYRFAGAFLADVIRFHVARVTPELIAAFVAALKDPAQGRAELDLHLASLAPLPAAFPVMQELVTVYHIPWDLHVHDHLVPVELLLLPYLWSQSTVQAFYLHDYMLRKEFADFSAALAPITHFSGLQEAVAEGSVVLPACYRPLFQVVLFLAETRKSRNAAPADMMAMELLGELARNVLLEACHPIACCNRSTLCLPIKVALEKLPADPSTLHAAISNYPVSLRNVSEDEWTLSARVSLLSVFYEIVARAMVAGTLPDLSLLDEGDRLFHQYFTQYLESFGDQEPPFSGPKLLVNLLLRASSLDLQFRLFLSAMAVYYVELLQCDGFDLDINDELVGTGFDGYVKMFMENNRDSFNWIIEALPPVNDRRVLRKLLELHMPLGYKLG